jgi:heat shock protein HslJ
MFKQIQILLGCTGLFVATSFALPPYTAAQTHQLMLMAQSSSALTGRWRLVDIGDPTSPTVIPQTTELTAEFADGRISGSGGCNRFMGGYTSEDGQLSISDLASTFMACEETVMNQEAQYLAALQGAQQYEIDDQGLLTIFYETDQELGVLHFVSDTTAN